MPASTEVQCPDSGACWHNCPEDMNGKCWRTLFAAPLTGRLPLDRWPERGGMDAVPLHPPRSELEHLHEVLPQAAYRAARFEATMRALPDTWARAFPPIAP